MNIQLDDGRYTINDPDFQGEVEARDNGFRVLGELGGVPFEALYVHTPFPHYVSTSPAIILLFTDTAVPGGYLCEVSTGTSTGSGVYAPIP